MLQTSTVAPGTLELLKKVMADPFLKDFRLVGGTSLALQLGHRISVDLDLFSVKDFDETVLRDYMVDNYGFVPTYIAPKTIKGTISGVKFDCIAHSYPWLRDSVDEDGIRLASMVDLCAMKLNAILGNGTRIKDYIDLAYLSQHFSLSQMFNFFKLKYNVNPVILYKAIVFFDDINKEEPIKLLKKKRFNWDSFAKRLLSMVKYPDRIFKSI